MLHCYCVKDEKMETFNSPWFAKGEVDAMRSLVIAVNQPESNLNRFPEDFTFYYIGEYDEKTGVFTSPKNGPEKKLSISTLIKTPKQ
ncbi:MAG: nonstructural protein [Microviridae sp.]|nr:MAG: nonstructural protein [Microviridae sp.]